MNIEEIEGEDDIIPYINLHLAIIYQACVDGDKEWLLSEDFRRMISYIPDRMVEEELGVGLVDMHPRQIATTLIKRIEQGKFRGRRSIY